MSSDWEQFVDEYESAHHPISDHNNFPTIDEPADPPPSLSEAIHGLDEGELADALDGWVRWHTFFEAEVGKQGALESALKQHADSLRRNIYMEYYGAGKFNGLLKEHQNHLVDSDERLTNIQDKIAQVRQNYILAKSYRDTFEKMAVRCYHERKMRRDTHGL